MYHQLCTGYYHLNTTGVEHEVAHVYEHMLVMTAHRRLAAAGVGNLLAGWVAGETFPRMMFIDYTLYTAQAEQVLAAYMAGPNRIDWDLLDQELQRVQTEARSVITNQAIADPTSSEHARLTRALQKLDRRPFYRYDDATQGNAGDEFTPTYHAHLARDLPALAQELTAHPSNLAAYRDCFAHDPEWRDAPKEYYRATGLLATRQAIARALTPGNIHTLLGKLQLEVRPATQAARASSSTKPPLLV
jgi:hypothetical protein